MNQLTLDELSSMYSSWSYDLENANHFDPEYLEIIRAGDEIHRWIDGSAFTLDMVETAADALDYSPN